VLDIGFAINRTLIYAVISFGLVLVFGLIEWGSEQFLPHEKLRASAALSAGAALTITMVFHSVKEFVEHTIERLLFRSWHDNETRLRQFVHRASFIGKQDALAAASVTAISQFAGGADCAIYLASGDGYARVKGEPVDPITIVADQWVNALLVGATVEDMGSVAALIERPDSPFMGKLRARSYPAEERMGIQLRCFQIMVPRSPSSA